MVGTGFIPPFAFLKLVQVFEEQSCRVATILPSRVSLHLG